MEKNKKLIIVGDGEFAEIAYEYFTYDSEYQVVGFAVERLYLSKTLLFNLPVIALEELENHYPPEDYEVYTAITFTKMNRIRRKVYELCKQKGYRFASYVSSRAFVWRNVEIGENCFIFEGNTLQYNVKIGNNVVLWSGNHIGHRAAIGDHCFLSSHVVVSGYCKIGESCFVGVNASFADTLEVAEDTFVGAGTVVFKNIETPGQIIVGNPARSLDKTVYKKYGV